MFTQLNQGQEEVTIITKKKRNGFFCVSGELELLIKTKKEILKNISSDFQK